VQSVYFISRN